MKLLFVLVPTDGILTQKDKDNIKDKGSACDYQIIILEKQTTRDVVEETFTAEQWEHQLGVRVHAAFTMGPYITPEELWSLLRRYSSDESPRFYRCERVSTVSYGFNVAKIKELK